MPTSFDLLPVEDSDLPSFKAYAQEAFQKGFEEHFGKSEQTILPERDIDASLSAKGAIAYKAIQDGKMVGGAIVNINNATGVNHLDFLFVRYGMQGKGIGKRIWFEIEKFHPETNVWRTCTPYFERRNIHFYERRNIHFYVNVCGFRIIEFFNEKHPMPDCPEDFIGDGNEGLFEFEKIKE